MSRALVISARLHEGWYHGAGNTPSPARLFQALVAGAGIGGPLKRDAIECLTWLERQGPPIVAAPHTMKGQAVVTYVPHNDLDAKEGDPRRIGEIRAKKPIAPLLFDPLVPFLFAWTLENDEAVNAAEGVCRLAERLYQLGRPVDMAWAWGDVVSSEELKERLDSYPGVVRRPSSGIGNVECPAPGSLESLNRRHAAASRRFDQTADRKGQTYRQRPKPKWRRVSYEGNASRLVLELCRTDTIGFAPWPLERATELTERVRDGAVERLRGALPDRIQEINRIVIGRKPNGENDGPTSERIQFIPLPSIGHPQADMQIRRILIEIPGECPMRADDIDWAASGIQVVHPTQNDSIDVSPSADLSQLRRYGIDAPARVWRTVTPVALPDATRRRIDPNRRAADAKPGREKYREQVSASFAVAQALRHAGIAATPTSVRAQREPFDLRGERVEAFAVGTRFNKHSLWHLEIEFESPFSGPLAIGDGRFLGLGVMRPIRPRVGVFGFLIESGLNDNPDPRQLSRALRRAVMARARNVLGTARIPAYFSGHREDSSPARSEFEPHLAFVFHRQDNELFVVAPERLDRRGSWDYQNLEILEAALQDFQELRAGVDGYLRLGQLDSDLSRHRLFSSSRVWESVTSYDVNRHARRSTAEATLVSDVTSECERRGLPRPEVTVLEWKAESRLGLRGKLCLEFKNVIDGPVILGKSRHQGGGVFAAVR